MLVYFVRHGQSIANIENIHHGSESPLSQLGIKQAQFIAKRFTNIHIDQIISSPYKRTKQTAQIIGKKLKLTPKYSKLAIERRLPSETFGKSFKDKQVKIFIDKINKNSKPNYYYSNEENYYDAKMRASNLLKKLSKNNSNSLLVVTHSFFLRILIATMIFGKDINNKELNLWLNALKSNNTGITLCEYNKDEFAWRLIIWNDHSHLG